MGVLWVLIDCPYTEKFPGLNIVEITFFLLMNDDDWIQFKILLFKAHNIIEF